MVSSVFHHSHSMKLKESSSIFDLFWIFDPILSINKEVFTNFLYFRPYIIEKYRNHKLIPNYPLILWVNKIKIQESLFPDQISLFSFKADPKFQDIVIVPSVPCMLPMSYIHAAARFSFHRINRNTDPSPFSLDSPPINDVLGLYQRIFAPPKRVGGVF